MSMKEEIIIRQCHDYTNIKDILDNKNLDLVDGWWSEIIIYNKDSKHFFHSEIYLFEFLDKLWYYLEKTWDNAGQVFTLVGFDQDYFFNVQQVNGKFIITTPIYPVEGIKTENYVYDFDSFIKALKIFTSQCFNDAEIIFPFLQEKEQYKVLKNKLLVDGFFFQSRNF